MEDFFLTDRGQVRKLNEDSGGIYYNKSGQMLAVIADGMGGHQAGDVASQLATKQIEEEFKGNKELSNPREAEAWLKTVFEHINEKIYNLSHQTVELKGMGTTIVVSIHGEDFVTIGHIGDSRCYIHNENGFKQITQDHSLVTELVRSGQISENDAKHHPRKNIVLKALGTEHSITSDVRSMGWELNDKLLLCSDGLTDKMSNATIKGFIESGKKINVMGQELIDLANERGGEDNISLIIVHNTPTKEEGDVLC